MTLILTCLTKNHIVQVADRRLTMGNGSLYDDDTNKAVIFNGRVAVAYTGLAIINGKPTAEWIGECMSAGTDLESAMNLVAERADRNFRRYYTSDKRLAVVATGWATERGGELVRPLIVVASNFLTEKFEPKRSADRKMVVQHKFIDENVPIEVFHFGQGLTPKEKIDLNRSIKRVIKHGANPRAIAAVLYEFIYSVASGRDARAGRVGKGAIIQILSRKAVMSGNQMFVTPLTCDPNSFLYISKDRQTGSFQAPIVAYPGVLLTNFGGGSIAPGEKDYFRTEMEKSAQERPIRVSSNQTQYSLLCPFCANEAKNRGSAEPENIVAGEIPLVEKEVWVYCPGTGHLLLVQREEV